MQNFGFAVFRFKVFLTKVLFTIILLASQCRLLICFAAKMKSSEAKHSRGKKASKQHTQVGGLHHSESSLVILRLTLVDALHHSESSLKPFNDLLRSLVCYFNNQEPFGDAQVDCLF